MNQPLPYCDGHRTCIPVKCVLFFYQLDAQHYGVSVVFTDKAEERLLPKHEPDSNWAFTGEDLDKIIQLIKIQLIKSGYFPKDATNQESRGYNYIRFDLEPLDST